MRTRNVVVVVTGVAIILLSLLALDVRFREDDEASGEGPPGEPQGAELAVQPDLTRRSELDPATGAADSATTLDEAMRLAPTEQQQTSPGRLPRPRVATDLRLPKGPLVSRPLPRTDSAKGGLVGGYPERVLRPVPDARVRSSSISSSQATEQVSLTATTASSPEEVAAFYRQWLARFGFVETVSRSQGESTGWGFQRGRDSVVVTTTPRREGCSFMLLGVLHAS